MFNGSVALAFVLATLACGGDKSPATPTSPGTIPSGMQVDKLRDAARSAGKLVGAAVQSGYFWGFTDAHSWIDAQFAADDPLLFDDQYGAKPAQYGVLDALLRR